MRKRVRFGQHLVLRVPRPCPDMAEWVRLRQHVAAAVEGEGVAVSPSVRQTRAVVRGIIRIRFGNTRLIHDAREPAGCGVVIVLDRMRVGIRDHRLAGRIRVGHGIGARIRLRGQRIIGVVRRREAVTPLVRVARDVVIGVVASRMGCPLANNRDRTKKGS